MSWLIVGTEKGLKCNIQNENVFQKVSLIKSFSILRILAGNASVIFVFFAALSCFYAYLRCDTIEVLNKTYGLRSITAIISTHMRLALD